MLIYLNLEVVSFFILHGFCQISQQVCIINRDLQLCIHRTRILMLLVLHVNMIGVRLAGLVIKHMLRFCLILPVAIL